MDKKRIYYNCIKPNGRASARPEAQSRTILVRDSNTGVRSLSRYQSRNLLRRNVGETPPLAVERLHIFFIFFFIGILLLLGRLFELQIILGARNRQLAEGNRIRQVVLPAPRGIIFDRKGKELVRNVPVYRKCQMSNVK